MTDDLLVFILVSVGYGYFIQVTLFYWLCLRRGYFFVSIHFPLFPATINTKCLHLLLFNKILKCILRYSKISIIQVKHKQIQVRELVTFYYKTMRQEIENNPFSSFPSFLLLTLPFPLVNSWSFLPKSYLKHS